MPRYVFEVSATLPEDQYLTVEEANAVNQWLAEHMEVLLIGLGKSDGKIKASEPFEQVTEAGAIHA